MINSFSLFKNFIDKWDYPIAVENCEVICQKWLDPPSGSQSLGGVLREVFTMKNDSVKLGNHGGEDDGMEDDEEGGDDNEVFIMKSTWGLMMTANLANMSGRTVEPKESSEMSMNGQMNKHIFKLSKMNK